MTRAFFGIDGRFENEVKSATQMADKLGEHLWHASHNGGEKASLG